MSPRITRRSLLRSAAGVSAALAFGPIGCRRDPSEVVLYTSVDQPIAAPIVEAFHSKHPDIHVRLVTDTEASKSVGLAVRLRAEAAHPICHVYWGNEVFLTIGLADEGLLAPLPDGIAPDVPAAFRSATNHWVGNGLRARVMAVANGIDGVTGKLDDLLDPRFNGRAAMAKPLAGTTGGHVAALYELWGDARADAYFRKLRDNGAKLLGGNSDVADAVGNGSIQLGLTDNDDCASSIANGGKLKLVPLEQQAAGIGTLAMPTTLGLVKRNDASPAALELLKFLASADVEQRLMAANFTAYSVRSGTPSSLKTMAVTYDAAAKRIQSAPRRVMDIFDRGA